MLLASLQRYAEQKKLLDGLPLQKRTVHGLIAIGGAGELRCDYLLTQTAPDYKGNEKPGREILLPRFPGENNGGKAYFLADNVTAVLGRNRRTGDPILSDPVKGKNDTKAFRHFWTQIEEAFQRTGDARLSALLQFRKRYLSEDSGLLVWAAPFLEFQENRSGKKELVGRTGPGDKDTLTLGSATIGFQVDGLPLTLEDPNDHLREYWFDLYQRLAFTDEGDEEVETRSIKQDSICLVTGLTGVSIARSHKPKILGVPGLSSGGYIVSFARECPSFSSYGFQMGENSPVSEQAAAQYCLAINELLYQDNTHINIDPVSVCFWSKDAPGAGSRIQRLLDRAYPEQVAAFIKAPFAGDANREVLHKARLHTVTLAGNAGRVVVKDWLDQPLIDAADNLKRWWDDLAIIEYYRRGRSQEAKEERLSSPLGIHNLARVMIRPSKSQKDDNLVGEHVASLFRASLGGTSMPVLLLKPILDEFHSAPVKDSSEKPLYPFNQSRFALIKVILIRNHNQSKEDAFMPTVELADTLDPAYNCGRLLAVLEAMQKRSRLTGMTNVERRSAKKPGGGVVARYYGRASTCPCLVLASLLSQSVHHLEKLAKGNENDRQAAKAIEDRKTEIISRFRATRSASPEDAASAPTFPALLTLEEQGRFALGFYQQKAHDQEQLRKYLTSQGKEGNDVASGEEEEEPDK